MIKGFIRKMEDAGDEYYNDLLWMGFFQIVGKCDDTCTTVIKMHDLIHDLAQLIAGKRVMELVSPNSLQSYFLLQKCGNFAHVRHASVICNFRSLGMPQLLYTYSQEITFPQSNVSPRCFRGSSFYCIYKIQTIKGVRSKWLQHSKHAHINW